MRSPEWQCPDIVWPCEKYRQEEGERAALSMNAGQFDFAAKQNSQLAADGQAEARTTVFAGSTRIGLLESLKNQPLLLRRDANAGVCDGERYHLAGNTEYRVIRSPSLIGNGDANVHLAMSRELDGVGEQILENLLQTLGVTRHGRR